MVDDVVNRTKSFLITSQMFLLTANTFKEYPRDYAVQAFTRYLTDTHGITDQDILNKLVSLTFEDIEILIASCLMEAKYKWLERDLLSRPFIWSTFFSTLGIDNPYSHDSMDFFATTLKKFNDCEVLGYSILPPETISRYPINLVNNDGGYAWIFNCRGLSDMRISQQTSSLLQLVKDIPKGSTITLIPTNFTAEFHADVFKKQVINTARDISEPTDALIQDFDVRRADANPRMEVRLL